MVIFAIFFALGVWLLQQQAALPDFAWAWLLLISPLTFYPFYFRRSNPLVRSIYILLLAALARGSGFSQHLFRRQDSAARVESRRALAAHAAPQAAARCGKPARF